MIPKKIVDLLVANGQIPRAVGRDKVMETLQLLGIGSDSEFGEFYQEYDPSLLSSDVSYEQLEDAVEAVVDGQSLDNVKPEESPLYVGSQFIWETWGLPKDFIALTSLEGEGGYIYSASDEKVYDIDSAEAGSLAKGGKVARWNSFYSFIEWYLS